MPPPLAHKPGGLLKLKQRDVQGCMPSGMVRQRCCWPTLLQPLPEGEALAAHLLNEDRHNLHLLRMVARHRLRGVLSGSVNTSGLHSSQQCGKSRA